LMVSSIEEADEPVPAGGGVGMPSAAANPLLRPDTATRRLAAHGPSEERRRTLTPARDEPNQFRFRPYQ
jgi:hypothetical protein